MVDDCGNLDVYEDVNMAGAPRWTVTGKRGRLFDRLPLQFLCLSSNHDYTQGKQNANRWKLNLVADGVECPIDMQVMASMKDKDRFLKAMLNARRKRRAAATGLVPDVPIKRERHESSGMESVSSFDGEEEAGSPAQPDQEAFLNKISKMNPREMMKLMELFETHQKAKQS